MSVAPARLWEVVARRQGLEPQEGRLLLLMGVLVATLFCGYTIAKVLRDALFLAEFGALALPYAYVGVALSSVGFVWLESHVARRFRDGEATRLSQYIAIGLSIVAALVLPHARHWTAAWFYVWTGSQAMMLLPHFWMLALDVWDSRRARRVFPLLAGGGLIGGMAGGAIAAWSVPIGHVGLMWILTGFLILAHVLTRIAEAHRAGRPERTEDSTDISNWAIIRRSTYIKVLVVGLALSVIVSTLVDFQFKNLVQTNYPDPEALTRFLGTFYLGLNTLALLIQFGAAGWLMERLSLSTSSGLQPAAVMGFAALTAFSTGGWAVIAMRWTQGVVSQSLGKSATEIYYAAIRPSERRRIKPAIDTLVERWSDAAVGGLLIVALHLLRLPLVAIAVGTAVLSAAWLVVLFSLNRQYGSAFRQALSSRWIEPEEASESLRTPLARKALLEALIGDDVHRIVFALKLGEHTHDPAIASAVRRSLGHPSPLVRAAANRAMEAMRIPDPDRVIEGFLGDPVEGVRRSAVSYLFAMSDQRAAFAHGLLDGDDPVLQRYMVDVLFDRPHEAQGLLTLEWIDARLASGAREDVLLAAHALGTMTGSEPLRRLRKLLEHEDIEIRRAALVSATRRPRPELLDTLLPFLLVPELSYEARRAVAAVGDPAVHVLRPFLNGEHGAHAQELAARTLARIAKPLAIQALVTLARSPDLGPRHLGLHGLMRLRVRIGRAVLPQSTAHRFFLRELNDYRDCLEPALALDKHTAPEIRLLAESYLESAQMALERAFWALATAYEPKPLFGALDRLESRDPTEASPALEYLGHVLPHAVFQPVSKIFEPRLADAATGASESDALAGWIRKAWESEDGWLRACAVRAARCVTGFDLRMFAGGDGGDPRVRAELEALSAGSPEAHAC